MGSTSAQMKASNMRSRLLASMAPSTCTLPPPDAMAMGIPRRCASWAIASTGSMGFTCVW